MLKITGRFYFSFLLIFTSIWNIHATNAKEINIQNVPYQGAEKCVHKGSGLDYPVGPNQKYKSIADVPWASLKEGDSVRIFYKPTPYKEKIIISTSGSTDQPIRICGVRGANGERPILDGDGAVNARSDKEAYGDYEPMQALAIILIWNRDYDLKANNITIEGLHIRNGKSKFSFTATDGEQRNYEKGSACIRVQAGDNIIIRDNELENCGNGIFTMSQAYNEASLTRNILIEGNYLHGHSEKNSYREHAMYIQAIGATYQFNYFGPNAVGSGGVALKERVAGSVIRYNWFEPGSARVLDLVEVEDAAPYYIEQEYLNWLKENNEALDPTRLAKVQAAELAYRKTYVYGNFIRHVGSKTDAGTLVHYGWDNDPTLARRGVLYFYNNTISILEDIDDNWRFRLFHMGLYSEEAPIMRAQETVEAFNNIIYAASETKGAAPAYLCFGSQSGTINFGRNWISPHWRDEGILDNCYYGNIEESPIVNGVENLISSANSELPIDPKTLFPNDIPSVQSQAQSLPKTLFNHPVNMQYIADMQSETRPFVSDLGAYELMNQSNK